MSYVPMMRDLYDALGRGDMPAVLGAIDPGIQWREPGSNSRGRAGHGLNAIVNNLSDGKVTSFQQYVNTPQLLDVDEAR